MNTELKAYIQKLDFGLIPARRQNMLNELAVYLKTELQKESEILLQFICTHNSRRSHIAQIWSTLAAYHYQKPIISFSGGVEVTHFNTRVQEALKRCGFNVKSNTEANPKVLLSFSDIEEPIECFSKLWNDEHNPQSGFIAIMVCSEAELACPYIPTAKKRLSITYDDPKDFDDTVLETTMYDARCLQIATEIFYTYRQLINEI